MRLRLHAAAVFCLIVLALSGCARPEAKKARYVAEGRNFLDKEDYSRAILAFKNAATAVPADAETQYQLGLAFMAAGDLQSDLVFQKSDEIEPGARGSSAPALAAVGALWRQRTHRGRPVARVGGGHVQVDYIRLRGCGRDPRYIAPVI